MNDGKHVILCVDDDQDILDAMQMILEGEGFAVRTASSGEEALRKYKGERPDMVLVDLMMEEVDSGVNLVKELKALGEPPPIYMMSAVGDELYSTIDFSSLGLNGVLQKPVQPRTLVSALKAALR